MNARREVPSARRNVLQLTLSPVSRDETRATVVGIWKSRAKQKAETTPTEDR